MLILHGLMIFFAGIDFCGDNSAEAQNIRMYTPFGSSA